MSVTNFPQQKSADSFNTNYWFFSNPNESSIEPIRIVHSEMAIDKLLSINLEGMTMGWFITKEVARHLQLSSIGTVSILCSDGKSRELLEVGPIHMKWGGSLEEQKERSQCGDPTTHEYENINAFVWSESCAILPYSRKST